MNTLEKLREQIDTIDEQLVEMLVKRVSLMKQVGEAKKAAQKPIRDQERESQKLATLTKQAHFLNIPSELVMHIWKLLFEASEEIER